MLKRLACALLCVAACAPVLANRNGLWRGFSTLMQFAPIAADYFAYSNGALPSPWAINTAQTAHMQVSSSVVTTNTLSADNNYRYTTGTFPANQFSAVRIGTPGTGTAGTGYGATVRMASGSQSYYFGVCNATGWGWAKAVSGTPTAMGSGTGTTCQSGDWVWFVASGTTLTLYRVRGGAWTQLATTTDSSNASGTPGIAYSSTDNGGSITAAIMGAAQ